MKTSTFVISLLLVFLLVFGVTFVTYPDHSRRGQVVTVAGTTWGFILSEQKEFIPRRTVRVLYPTTTGEWLEKDLPADLVKPMQVIQMP